MTFFLYSSIPLFKLIANNYRSNRKRNRSNHPLLFKIEGFNFFLPLLRESGEGSLQSIEKGMKASRWRETGSRISARTSGTVTNLSARLLSFSPPAMTVFASITATEMPCVDLQLSTYNWSCCCCDGAGGCDVWWFFTMLLQH